MKTNIDNNIRSQQICNILIFLGVLFFQSLIAKDVNLQALEPGKRENNIYHVWIYFDCDWNKSDDRKTLDFQERNLL